MCKGVINRDRRGLGFLRIDVYKGIVEFFSDFGSVVFIMLVFSFVFLFYFFR